MEFRNFIKSVIRLTLSESARNYTIILYTNKFSPRANEEANSIEYSCLLSVVEADVQKLPRFH